MGNAIFEIGLYTSNLIPLPDVKISETHYPHGIHSNYGTSMILDHRKLNNRLL